ncbi:HsdM family class I SAM-dependent methyltransferase [Marinobacter subterrani]|uniref:site-specific DNA-methyltransferase (adenine-specific) n=1 Tax=Marinobacter subterrani TaxID=1658765 RepID=A0A0J7LWQ3_9GAMM|nr:N-6 DNA methylase [Marinobacter subterrani]KMQ73315.1 N-6 DNA Methylase [Marinobacter subterrani]
MTAGTSYTSNEKADWLFSIGEGSSLPIVDGLVSVSGYTATGRPPEEVAIMEKARSYGAHAVFFEAERHGRSAVAQAFIFNVDDEPDDARFAELHKRLWSWGGVPLIYRTGSGLVQLFRCAHKPDFVGADGIPICSPIKTLSLGAKIAAQDIWWDAARIRNGAIWDDPHACKLMLSAQKAAHRTLAASVAELEKRLSESQLLPSRLRRRLLILSLLIAYLEERSVLLPTDFESARKGAKRFFEVLGDGEALTKLLGNLEDRFNGRVFRLTDLESSTLKESADLAEYAKLVEGNQDSTGQLSLWRLYSFRDLPVELISNIYQIFVKNTSSSVYTPPALVRLVLEEALSWEKLDRLVEHGGIVLDPACGSGVFLVEAYKRLVLHWRWRNDWAEPHVEDLQRLLRHVHGIDLEEGAVELAAFSLCLSLCDALQPEEIRSSVRLFPQLAGETLHHGCFFEAKSSGLIQASVSVIIGNPPFESSLTTEGAQRSYDDYSRTYGTLADKQLAYLFLHEAMEMLMPGGTVAMIEPAGFLYNQNAIGFRRTFFNRWCVREVLDFVSIRGLFKKGGADTKVIVVIAEAKKPLPRSRMLHAVFRRNGRANAEQGFDIDYYDLHWLRNRDAECATDVWRANLLGGGRARRFIERLRSYPTIKDYASRRGWNFGEGYLGGKKNASSDVQHLVGQPLLPTQALGEGGIDRSLIEIVPDAPIKDPKSAERFLAPLLLIKENQNLYCDIWSEGYLTYKNEIVGFSAPGDFEKLEALASWIRSESKILKAYVAGISSRLFTQRATSIFNADIFSLPYPQQEEGLDVSVNERVIAEDIVDYQRDFIRLGSDAPVMQVVPPEALTDFDAIFTRQINNVYESTHLRVLQAQHWPGAICKAFVFGDGEVDWSCSSELQDRLDTLLVERRGSGLTVTRIARVYDKNFLFLLKPDRHRFWTRSIALRDADDVLADLRGQGF